MEIMNVKLHSIRNRPNVHSNHLKSTGYIKIFFRCFHSFFYALYTTFASTSPAPPGQWQRTESHSIKLWPIMFSKGSSNRWFVYWVHFARMYLRWEFLQHFVIYCYLLSKAVLVTACWKQPVFNFFTRGGITAILNSCAEQFCKALSLFCLQWSRFLCDYFANLYSVLCRMVSVKWNPRAKFPVYWI